MRLLLIGPPGVGKGTQAQQLSQHFQIPKISSGDMLRAHVRTQSSLGLKAHEFMGHGHLVPDDLILAMIEERLRMEDSRVGFILDGFPRTVPQAVGLDNILKRKKKKLDAILALSVSAQTVVTRLSSRRSCENCGMVYNLIVKPPTKPDICDRCGGRLVQRSDDKPSTLRERLSVYERMTEPLLAYYKPSGLLYPIAGNAGMDEILRNILSLLDDIVGKR